jgi:hypothetical protein
MPMFMLMGRYSPEAIKADCVREIMRIEYAHDT